MRSQFNYQYLLAYTACRREFEVSQRTGSLFRSDLFGMWNAGGEL